MDFMDGKETRHLSRLLLEKVRCTRARTQRGWVELDEAVRELGLFSMDALPQITHGMCADCAKLIISKVKGSGGFG